MKEIKNRKLKCYIYTRVSTEMQVDGYSLDAQKDRLIKYADYQGMQVVREYCDAGKSGKSIAGRPEFTQMLKDVTDQRDNVDYILVFKLSRFGRNAADVLNSLQLIQDYGTNLICVEDGIDSSKESGKLTITVLSAVAEIERENILVQTMEGRKQKAREGKWNGGKIPFGYQLDKETETFIPDPNESEIVKIIFDKFAHTSMGTDSIATFLNSHGYMKNKSRDFEVGHFTRTFVTRILDNPVYLGKVVYGRTKTEKVKGKRDEYHRVHTDDCVCVEGKHEALIDEATWNVVRARRAETGVKLVKTHSLGHEHLLTGLLRCPICGGTMNGMVNRNVSKKNQTYVDFFYYRCAHRKTPLANGKKCDFKPIKQNDLNAEVEKIIFDMARSKEVAQLIQDKISEKIDISNLEKERSNLTEQLTMVQKSKSKLMEQLDKLDVTDRNYGRKYEDMQKRLEVFYDRIGEIENNIADVDAKIEAKFGDKISMEDLWKILTQFDKLYSKMTELEKKEFYRSFINYIELYPEKRVDGKLVKHIDFKFPVCFEANENKKILHQETYDESVALLQRN